MTNLHVIKPLLGLGCITVIVAGVLAIAGRRASSKLKRSYGYALAITIAALGMLIGSLSVYQGLTSPTRFDIAIQGVTWAAGCISLVGFIAAARYAGRMKSGES
jgi:hypothetical protein